MIHIIHLRTSFDEGADRFIGSFDSLWKLVYILRLDDSFEIIFQNFGEIV